MQLFVFQFAHRFFGLNLGYNIILLMPFLIRGTLKLIRKPRRLPRPNTLCTVNAASTIFSAIDSYLFEKV